MAAYIQAVLCLSYRSSWRYMIGQAGWAHILSLSGKHDSGPRDHRLVPNNSHVSIVGQPIIHWLSEEFVADYRGSNKKLGYYWVNLCFQHCTSSYRRVTDNYLLFSCWISHVWFFCNPKDCNPLGSFVRGISHSRILELPFSSPGVLLNPGIEPESPALAGRFFTTESPGKPWLMFITCSLNIRYTKKINE